MRSGLSLSLCCHFDRLSPKDYSIRSTLFAIKMALLSQRWVSSHFLIFLIFKIVCLILCPVAHPCTPTLREKCGSQGKPEGVYIAVPLSICRECRGSWFQIPNEDQLVFLSSHAQSFPESKLILCVFSVHSEILRVVDSLQLTATKKVATPANWQVILSLLYYKI